MKSNMHQQGVPTSGVLELFDRTREELAVLCGQYHALKHEFEKLSADKNELQKHYVLHYEMSHALNMEMHKQIEVLKRLQGACSQIMHYLPSDPQGQLAQALEASKQLTCQDPGSTLPGPIGPPPLSLSGGMHPMPSGHSSSMHMNNGPTSYTPGMPMNIGMGPTGNKDDRSISPGSPGSSGMNQSSMPRYGRSGKMGESVNSNAGTEPNSSKSSRDHAMSSCSKSNGNSSSVTGSSHQQMSRRRQKSKDAKNNSSEDTTSETEDEIGQSSENDNESNEGANSSSPRSKVTSTSPGAAENHRGTSSNVAKYGHHHHHHYHQHGQKHSAEYNGHSGGGMTSHHTSAGPHPGPPGSSGYMRVGMSNQYPPYMMGHPLPPPHGSSIPPPHSDMQNQQYHHPGVAPLPNVHPGAPYMRGGHSMRAPPYDPCMGGGHPPSHVASRMRIPPPSSPYAMQHVHHSRGGAGVMPGPSSYHIPNNSSGRPSSIASEDGSNAGGSPACGFPPNSSGSYRLNPIGALPHGEVICAIAIDSSNRHIFTGGKGTVKVWETASIGMPNITPMVNLECYQDKYIRSCKLMPNGEGLLVGGESETLVLWDLNTGQQSLSMTIRSVIETSYAACYAVALSQDGKLCYSCINDGKIAIWDLTSRTLVREIVGHENGASCIDLLNDGYGFWTGGLDQDIRSWDLRESRSISEYHCDAQVFTISLAPSNDWLAAGLENSNIEVIYPKNNERFKMNYHESCVMSVKVAKSGRWMASTGKDSSVRLFKMPRRSQEVCCRESDLMLSCDISDNENLLVAGSANKTAIVFQPSF